MSTVISAAPNAAISPTRWAALIVSLSAIFMDMLDTTIINVALPSIQRSFGANQAALTWMVAAYTLAFALVLTTGGRLGDIYAEGGFLSSGSPALPLRRLSRGWQLMPRRS